MTSSPSTIIVNTLEARATTPVNGEYDIQWQCAAEWSTNNSGRLLLVDRGAATEYVQPPDQQVGGLLAFILRAHDSRKGL